MRLIAYFSLLAAALICSLIHVVMRSKAEASPGKIVLETFFLSFAIIGASSLWWILTAPSEMSRAFGVLGNGVFLGGTTLACMHLAFYFNRHRELSPKAKNSHERHSSS